MKQFTLLVTTLLAAASLSAQVVFESGLDNWADGLPTDWYGERSSIAQENVVQVNNDGNFAVQLVNATTSHKRFTTQHVGVENGQSFEIEFKAKGQGDIRTAIFDGREGTGYSGYNDYVSVNSSDWQTIVQYVSAENTADTAEFILSVRNTVEGGGHLQVDDVVISLTNITAPEYTIYEIQYSTEPDAPSPLLNELVQITGVVTARNNSGFHIQDAPGAWNGVYVFGSNSAEVGDNATLIGTVAEYFTATQITNVLAYTINATDQPLPEATQLTTAEANDEQYEGVLVSVENATCVEEVNQYNEWTVNDGSGDLVVDDLYYNYGSEVLGEVYALTGPLTFSFGEYKILPRSAQDVVSSSGPSLTSIYDIQFSTEPGGESPLLGQSVTTGGIVTAVVPEGFFIQDGLGEWRGVYVFDQDVVVNEGDSVVFSAVVDEFFGYTELSDVSNLTVVSAGNDVYQEILIAGTELGESYEGVQVSAIGTCTSIPNEFGQWIISDGTDIMIDSEYYTYETPEVGQTYQVWGPVRFAFGEYRISPLNADDVQIFGSVGDEGFLSSVSIFPNPTSGTLNLNLGDAQGEPVAISVFDLTGKLVLEGSSASSIKSLNLDKLEEGSYLVQLSSGRFTSTRRVVKL